MDLLVLGVDDDNPPVRQDAHAAHIAERVRAVDITSNSPFFNQPPPRGLLRRQRLPGDDAKESEQ
jgi:hypothetical protein